MGRGFKQSGNAQGGKWYEEEAYKCSVLTRRVHVRKKSMSITEEIYDAGRPPFKKPGENRRGRMPKRAAARDGKGKQR